MHKPLILSAVLSLIALGAPACTEAEAAHPEVEDAPTDPRFTADGRLIRPDDYREWIYVTSGLGMSYGPETPPGDPPFDNVFVHPDAYGVFKETGTWPDKTIFALELRGSAGEGSINEAGAYQTGLITLEASVKDEARFPEAWAYFGFGTPEGTLAETAAPLPKEACFNCHAQNAAVDNTFVQFYPTLFEIAERHGTLRPDYPK
ncbi:cytochrome P460 family protein [Sorangium sp. So ce1036]|uniref:cytochrome P460 family protein n=1 Tax=Sorangium sp. So ce1036 TaxID=3133328 RepID=UPI003F0C017B